MKIGEQIYMARKHRGLTQDDLAKMCKVGRETISRVENGANKPSAKLLETMSAELDYDFVFSGNEPEIE